MKMCTDHWASLRKAVDDRGMSHLISVNGAKLAERLTEELEGQAPPDSFDPLSSATFQIYGQALKYGGLYLMQG